MSFDVSKVKKDAPNRKAFLTGSYAYGKPTRDSDIDLVVFVSETDLEKLRGQADDAPSDQVKADVDNDYISAGGTPLRFGRLNLICCVGDKYYDVWRKGTFELKQRAPVSRDEACAHFRKLRKEAGFCV